MPESHPILLETKEVRFHIKFALSQAPASLMQRLRTGGADKQRVALDELTERILQQFDRLQVWMPEPIRAPGAGNSEPDRRLRSLIPRRIKEAEVLDRVDQLRALQASDRIAARTGATNLRADVLDAISCGCVDDPYAVARAAMLTVDEGIGCDEGAKPRHRS